MHLFVSLFVYETDVVTFSTGYDFTLLSGQLWHLVNRHSCKFDGIRNTMRRINIVNFIRAIEPRFTTDLLLPVQKQMEIIVANAGITKDTLVMRMSDDDFESVIDNEFCELMRFRVSP